MCEQPPSCSKVTAVILAGGNSNNFGFLSDTAPKPLIKVAGKSILSQLLHNLFSSNFKDCLIVTNTQSKSIIEDHVNYCIAVLKQELSVESSVSVYAVDGLGTTDVLNSLSTRVKNDFIVIPCDLYGQFDFKAFVDEHLRTQRLCTIALLDQLGGGATAPAKGNTKGTPAKPTTGIMNVCLGGNDYEDWANKYRVVATLNEHNTRVLGILQQIALDNGDKYEIYKWHCPTNQKCTIRKHLIDIHVYAFSKHIFDITAHEPLINSSIRMDLLPYLIKMQNTPFLKDPDTTEKTWKISQLPEGNTHNVHFFLASGDQFKCSRVNSIDSLYSSNIQLCHKSKSVKKGKVKNVILGNSNINDTCEIKNSVIGDYVTIGNNVKITDSLVMDNCTIEDDTVLTKTVLGDSVVVEKGSNLKNMLVKSQSLVPSGTVLERDYIPSFM